MLTEFQLRFLIFKQFFFWEWAKRIYNESSAFRNNVWPIRQKHIITWIMIICLKLSLPDITSNVCVCACVCVCVCVCVYVSFNAMYNMRWNVFLIIVFLNNKNEANYGVEGLIKICSLIWSKSRLMQRYVSVYLEGMYFALRRRCKKEQRSKCISFKVIDIKQ